MKELDEVKGRIKKIGSEAKQTAQTVKKTIGQGVETSRKVADQANGVWKSVFKKARLQKGLDLTSKGADLLAKGARIASKGADSLATGVEKASREIQKLGTKIK